RPRTVGSDGPICVGGQCFGPGGVLVGTYPVARQLGGSSSVVSADASFVMLRTAAGLERFYFADAREELAVPAADLATHVPTWSPNDSSLHVLPLDPTRTLLVSDGLVDPDRFPAVVVLAEGTTFTVLYDHAKAQRDSGLGVATGDLFAPLDLGVMASIEVIGWNADTERLHLGVRGNWDSWLITVGLDGSARLLGRGRALKGLNALAFGRFAPGLDLYPPALPSFLLPTGHGDYLAGGGVMEPFGGYLPAQTTFISNMVDLPPLAFWGDVLMDTVCCGLNEDGLYELVRYDRSVSPGDVLFLRPLPQSGDSNAGAMLYKSGPRGGLAELWPATLSGVLDIGGIDLAPDGSMRLCIADRGQDVVWELEPAGPDGVPEIVRYTADVRGIRDCGYDADGTLRVLATGPSRVLNRAGDFDDLTVTETLPTTPAPIELLRRPDGTNEVRVTDGLRGKLTLADGRVVTMRESDMVVRVDDVPLPGGDFGERLVYQSQTIDYGPTHPAKVTFAVRADGAIVVAPHDGEQRPPYALIGRLTLVGATADAYTGPLAIGDYFAHEGIGLTVVPGGSDADPWTGRTRSHAPEPTPKHTDPLSTDPTDGQADVPPPPEDDGCGASPTANLSGLLGVLALLGLGRGVDLLRRVRPSPRSSRTRRARPSLGSSRTRHAGPSQRSLRTMPRARTPLVGILIACAATLSCGGDSGTTCAQEVPLGAWGRMTPSAMTAEGYLVTVENTTIFTALGPLVGTNIKAFTSGGITAMNTSLPNSHATEPVLDADGHVYVLQGGLLHSLLPTGVERFSTPAGNFIAVSQDGTLVTGGGPRQPEELQRLGPDGVVVLHAPVADLGYLIARVAIGGDGTLFALELARFDSGAPARARVLALTPGFDLKWAVTLAASANPGLAADADGGVIAVVGEHVVALDALGRERWQTTLEGASGSPSLGPDGTVYFASGAIGPDGQVRWRSAPGLVISPFTVAADGTLYAMVAAPDPKRAGRLDDAYDRGVGVFDPATGALTDRVFGTPTKGWGTPVFVAGSCGANAGENTLDGILFESSFLWFTKASTAPIAAPWGRPSADAANTSAAPLIATLPRTAADLRGFWVRDADPERFTLELADTSGLDPALDGLRDVYILWRTGATEAGTIAQVGHYRLDNGTLVLERKAGAAGGSTTALAASPWTELAVVDPIAGGASVPWRRAYGVARPAGVDAHLQNWVVAGKGLGGRAAFDPRDGIGWVVHRFSDDVRLNTPLTANGPSDLLVYRVDTAKETLVEAAFGGPGEETLPRDLVVDAAGDLHLVGAMPSWRDGTTRVNHLRVRRDLSTFDELTLPEAPGSGPVELMAIDRLPAGGAIAVGWQGASPNDANADLVLVRFDASGAVAEDRRIAAPGAQGATAVAVDSAGHVTVAGFLTARVDLGAGIVLEPLRDPGSDPGDPSAVRESLFVARFDADGRAVWGRTFAELAGRAAQRLDLVAWDDGTFALGGPLLAGQFGATLSFGLGALDNTFADPARPFFEPDDAFLVRFASDGTPLSQAHLTMRTLAGIAAAPGGWLVATGRSSD
ncbi:MAG: hypothetical protein JNJ59_00390, partial [Deltaproteobacteria bacterium]|nr:hypothetical protein [Deltaproteobacteria bacterium]